MNRSVVVVAGVLCGWLGACAGEEKAAPSAVSTFSNDAPAPSADSGAADASATVPGPVAPPTSVDAAPAQTHVPIFIAQGKLGRTTVSCDDGKTWIADRSEDPAARCWDVDAAKNVECDHDSWSSLGMVDTGDYFIATYGWGYPGLVRRTRDGIDWEDVLPGHTFAGMAFGNGLVVANGSSPFVSAAHGAAGSWTKGASVGVSLNVRRIGFVPDGGGRFIISLESGENSEIVTSDDNGQTWQPVTTRPALCAKSVAGILHGNGVTLMVQTNGSVCRSDDRGSTWSHVPVTDYFSSAPLFADGAFLVWQGSTRHRSTDGATWTSAVGTADVTIGAVARGPSGTFVAVRGGWQVWYEKQRFYRSTNGIDWEILPETAFVHGHPVTHIIAGMALPSAECPLPPSP